ncbi:MAG: hypothetical protein ABI883_01925 [Chthoniobacterales bacterium]
MTAEIAKIIQAIGAGTASRRSSFDPDPAATDGGVLGWATTTGAERGFAGGVAMSGWVFAILTDTEGGAAGSGRMLMRAVSFFGPAWVADPG